MRDGQRLATLMRKAVQQHYGAGSEKLVQFGVQPFRGRKTKPAPEGPGVEPTPETATVKTSS